MDERLVEYKNFIDDLVMMRPDVLVRWVKEEGWSQLPETKPLNKLLAELTPEQKDVVAQMVQQARRRYSYWFT
jgi:hypothetical protein